MPELVTTTTEVAVLPDNVAVIVDSPGITAVTRPREPAEVLTVATLVDELLQVTCSLIFWVVPSE
jgi:hypothetical protein